MIKLRFFLIGMILGNYSLSFAMTPAELAKEGKYEDAVKAYQKAIEAAKDDKEKALLHKELGDLFVSKVDFKNAAEEFIKALALSHKFPMRERLQIAIYLSWARKYDEAIWQLKSVLSEDSENLEARIHLAKILSWSGKLDEAIAEADKVLGNSPDNKDALLVKANALRWKGNFKKAIPIYEEILGKKEDFDSRLGLTYAYLSAGNIKAAKESRKLLQPQYPYQEKDLKQLDLDMDKGTKPILNAGYSYYNDSDDNRVYRYFSNFGFWLENWKLDLNYRHTDAKDNTRNNVVEELSLKAYSKPKEFLGLGGGIGLVQFKHAATAEFLTWNMKGDVNIWNGVAGLSLSREGFTDTAQLVTNEIRTTNLSLSITQRLADRFSLSGTYSYRDYSDGNNANDFQFSPTYSIYTKNPTITLGYRFRYLNFNRQSGGGYFDPNDFTSHQIFTSLSFEKANFYIYLEPYGGYQSFRRYGENKSDFFGGGSGILGLNVSKNVRLEANAEGGNYAVGTAAGFSYYLLGVRLHIFF